MSEPARIEDRVTKLETEMVEVRYLAAKADKEASTNTAVLRGQVGILNSLRADQVDQGKRLNHLDRKVEDGFAEMRQGFSVLGQGQQKITELLTNKPDKTGATDE